MSLFTFDVTIYTKNGNKFVVKGVNSFDIKGDTINYASYYKDRILKISEKENIDAILYSVNGLFTSLWHRSQIWRLF